MRRSSTTTRRSRWSTTSPGPSRSIRSSSAASSGTCIYNQIGGVVTRGRFGFDGRYTQNPLLPAAQRGGAAFADFLLGDFNNSEAQVGAPIANFRSNYFALYAQDSWRLGSNVTMNYGLRWEYDQPFTDTNDAIVNIDFDWANSHPPIFVRTGTGDPV